MTRADNPRIERGDFQTPDWLARAVVERLHRLGVSPSGVLEPTCGLGAFLVAAAARWPTAALVGRDLSPGYVAQARRALGPAADLQVADCFATDWAALLARLGAAPLVLGNPPWVTASRLGVLGSGNRPARRTPEGFSGLDATTGRSNFDLGEAVVGALLDALGERPAWLAMLCKATVARRLLPRAALVGVWRVDAAAAFGAAVDAVLMVAETGPGAQAGRDVPVFAALDRDRPEVHWGVRAGRVVADVEAWAEPAPDAPPGLRWRSGLKHDCAAVMELRRDDEGWVNGLGEAVDLEPSVALPLLKSRDLARGEIDGAARRVVVPQRALGQDTERLADEAPRAFAYLERHAERLGRRASSIYRRQPRFAVFGVGPYTFAPWKVAVSGLHAEPAFRVVGPVDGQPVVLDDTCYFAGYDDEAAARAAADWLDAPATRRRLRALMFGGGKRPLTLDVLAGLQAASR